MNFTDQQLKNWRVYESIREQGMFNMFDRRAMDMSDMDKSEWLFCMEHYLQLREVATKGVAQ